MDREPHRRWHATGAGSEQAPSLFRLSGRQATLFIASLGLAFAGFVVLNSSGLGLVAAAVAAASVPAATLAFLLSLCCGRHEGHAAHWLEWRRLRAGGRGLLEIGKGHEDLS